MAGCMKTVRLVAALFGSLLFVAAGCAVEDPGGIDGENTATGDDAIKRATIISRAEEWVNAKLHYCQAARGDVDFDSACWGWEGSSHRCDRKSNAAWNAYRSDCSGFVTWAWGMPAVGDGGYVTSDFAPFSNKFSHTIDGHNLQPGDALNKTNDEHIILFKAWVTPGQEAVFMEEPGCSSSQPYAHAFTSKVSISGDKVYVDYEGGTFYAIRYNSATGDNTGVTTKPSAPAADACSYGDGYCTQKLQCDNGHWIDRTDDPTACSAVHAVQESCDKGDGYCTHTLQCENGHWVPRQDDPAKCTAGPGVI